MNKLTNLWIAGATCFLLLFSTTSCVKSSSSYKKLQEQYDSVMMAHNESEKNIEEMLEIINEVEQSFQEIKEAENYVAVKRTSSELNETVKEEIRANMRIFSEKLAENRKKIASLNEELRKNRISSKALSNKIKQMTEQLAQKEEELNFLRSELAAKDIRISELGSAVEGLSRDVEDLATENKAKDAQIKSQDTDLHTAYYCFGSAQELKEQKIISGGGLFSSAKVLPEGFNRDYFLEIDTREVTSIPLFAPKARVRTSHPTSAYEFTTDAEGNMVLNITNTKEFWSLSKYLVVQVNL